MERLTQSDIQSIEELKKLIANSKEPTIYQIEDSEMLAVKVDFTYYIVEEDGNILTQEEMDVERLEKIPEDEFLEAIGTRFGAVDNLINAIRGQVTDII